MKRYAGTKTCRYEGERDKSRRFKITLHAFVSLCFPLLLLFILCSCRTAPEGGPIVAAIPQRGTLPAYRELVERYNANLAGLDRLWARADVTLRYRDEKGKWRSERGDDSKLLMVVPDKVALAVGGIGPPVLWIGGNEQQYWVFHLRDEKPVYYGSRARIGSPTTQPLPSPVYPHQVPWMLGVVTLDPNADSEVEWYRGYYLIEPPGTGTRMLIDPQTARPVRIDLLDSRGFSTLAVRLHDFVPVTQGSAKSSTPAPLVPSRIEAWVLGEGTQVTLKLNSVKDGRGDRAIERAFASAFDLQRLIQAHQPQVQVNLDSASSAAGGQ